MSQSIASGWQADDAQPEKAGGDHGEAGGGRLNRERSEERPEVDGCNEPFRAREGYVYPVYGDKRYLHYAVASAHTLRRYDTTRPVALLCEPEHREILEHHGLQGHFDVIEDLAPEHRSIVGFKHNVHRYLVFPHNLFLDSDMVWCRDPDPLWQSFRAYPFTITGSQSADLFFGAAKNTRIVGDMLLNRRRQTLRRFGLTYLSRVQSGMIYAHDPDTTRQVCRLASQMLDRKQETHFVSRTLEQGRTEESCEWSLAMAMAQLDLPVYPWHQGLNSPQLDYIDELTDHDLEFQQVVCRYYCDPFVYSLRGLKTPALRRALIGLMSRLPWKDDYMNVTPFVLHFGWQHQKKPFKRFAERLWNRLTQECQTAE